MKFVFLSFGNYGPLLGCHTFSSLSGDLTATWQDDNKGAEERSGKLLLRSFGYSHDVTIALVRITPSIETTFYKRPTPERLALQRVQKCLPPLLVEKSKIGGKNGHQKLEIRPGRRPLGVEIIFSGCRHLTALRRLIFLPSCPIASCP